MKHTHLFHSAPKIINSTPASSHVLSPPENNNPARQKPGHGQDTLVTQPVTLVTSFLIACAYTRVRKTLRVCVAL